MILSSSWPTAGPTWFPPATSDLAQSSFFVPRCRSNIVHHGHAITRLFQLIRAQRLQHKQQDNNAHLRNKATGESWSKHSFLITNVPSTTGPMMLGKDAEDMGDNSTSQQQNKVMSCWFLTWPTFQELVFKCNYLIWIDWLQVWGCFFLSFLLYLRNI